METRQLEWSVRSLADLVSITDYYAEVGGMELSWQARRYIEQVAAQLAEAPVLHRPGKHDTHEFPLPRFPYTLIYRVTAKRLRIIRVMHQARAYFND